ncbi:DUF4625 domain-containing protein [Gynurincola endophyticus]|jgi:major membrane immunogen (membrane-anchored lipoprotein)|uniref:DUF4625 domain-containing protein n=1 Tax=Gynurincola endophyticus TaxID=2479004 RepID=UPI000F8ECA20|nr:DUF4625 domain-containing protein [Gynurincola endophyticus]
MRIAQRLLTSLLVSSVLFTACSKDDDDNFAPPTIEDVELGSSNSRIAYRGSDFHIEAEIKAPGTIESVTVEIHGSGANAWEFEQVYTDGFKGLKNAELHKHIDVPATVALGNYHLHIVVLDQQGKKTSYEADIEVKEDNTLPSISTLELELNAAGDDLHVETLITAPNKIKEVEIEIHGGSWEEDFTYTDAAMVGQTSYTFHKHVNIASAPAGHYHVHFKVIDQAGKEREFEGHFDKP